MLQSQTPSEKESTPDKQSMHHQMSESKSLLEEESGSLLRAEEKMAPINEVSETSNFSE